MKLFAVIGALLLSFSAVAQQTYNITLDLKNVQNDQVKVVVLTPAVKEKSINYIIPSVIPGSYSQKDYGRFVTNFKAYDAKGKKLKTQKQGNNLFTIHGANKLAKLEYVVDDTWDVLKDENYIFQPGGTNIDAGNNFVINHFGFYGYLDGYKMLPYQVTIEKPDHLYGATSLPVERVSAGRDVLTAPDYVRLVDAPMMYSRPDTASFRSGNTLVSVSVHSETGVVKANQIKEMITPLATALTNFFGGMPVDRYHFIMYFPKQGETAITKFGGYGALEHSYSSMYFLPEQQQEENLRKMVLDVASHEFLHILTPLNIHSEEIEYFDFKDPKISQHLWLYEGVTEYFSNLVQLQEGLKSYDAFKEEMMDKMRRGSEFKDVSFTEMSRHIIEPAYQEMYGNVYQKGALIGFLLDIRLQELTQGKMGLRELMLQLSQQYGPNKPFKDDELIEVIVAASHPDIRQFFTTYVVGDTPLPYEEYYQKIGWNYTDKKKGTKLTFGEFRLGFEKSRQFYWVAEPMNNRFGFEKYDILQAVNGTPLTETTIYELLEPLFEVKKSTPVEVTFIRNNKLYKQTYKPAEEEVELRFVIEDAPAPTSEQLLLRAQVLKTDLP
ncbi:peptidase M61 [Pontibacter sp. SGAir0037]|uniref:M61 family metallopeptidase n=1 Tax=Pontibacter sp. SGAir0037 TaxID=2571030 RepID=UPI0010CD0AE6|nr:peptidase M61 [Pontibacter sp. SGAir0037]QCR23933.1 peptidase M61 [Pontibacter sp. SGAir0037]